MAETRTPGGPRLGEALQDYLQARAEHAVTGLTHRIGDAATKLAEDPAKLTEGLAGKLTGGGSPAGALFKLGAGALKQRAVSGVKERLGSLVGKGGDRKGRSGGGQRSINIVEDIDVGVPCRVAYDQWTQFHEFSTWAKGVQGVDRADDTTSNWKAKIFWSSRSWQGKVTEQVPDRRIAWTSEGAKGTTKGVVTFHPLADDLTKVLLDIQYFPKGLFEKTGNVWRAQGRRARLDLKLYRRFVMMRGEATGAWRGEIRDGEVVRSHEDAVAEEEQGKPQDEEFPEEEGYPDDEGYPEDEELPDEDEEDLPDEESDEEDEGYDEEEDEYEDERRRR